jgi:hypothetical protein
MNAVHNLKKRPSSKYISNRTISFSAEGEISHIRDQDTVNITIILPNGETLISIDGQTFLNNLEEKHVKSTGKKVLILRY